MFVSPGDQAVRECVQQGRALANVCQDPQRGNIQKCCDDLDRLMGELESLRSQGKVSQSSNVALGVKWWCLVPAFLLDEQ
jgi:hypothetical protein